MTQSVLPLILASGSPRRRELLDLMGLAYTVETPDVDESFSGKPAETVMEISRRKAVAVADDTRSYHHRGRIRSYLRMDRSASRIYRNARKKCFKV